MRIAALALALAAALAQSPATPPRPAPKSVTIDQLELRRFKLVFSTGAADAAALLAQSVESERDELARRLGRDWEGTTLVFIGNGPDELRSVAPPEILLPPWAQALALPQVNALVFDARALRGAEGRQVVLHELAHLALGRLGSAASGAWPRWFQEGFAMMVAGEWSLSRYTAMYRATLRDAAIPLSSLSDRWPEGLSEIEIAYAQSFSFVSFVYEKEGEGRFRQLIAGVAEGRSFRDSFRDACGVELEREEAAWRDGLSSRYSWVPFVMRAGTIWFAITLLFVAAYVRRRFRNRARLEAMELEEQAREAALRIASAEEAQKRESEPPTLLQ